LTGTLLPLETEILEVALSSRRSGHASFHGFGLAQTLRAQTGSRALTGHGTLYKALGRLEEFGLLSSRWEDATAAERRPRRRLYELTGQGARVAEQALADQSAQATRRPPRIASGPVGTGALLELAARKPRSVAHRAAAAGIGVAAIVFGEADDAPGLVLFGGLLIVGTISIGHGHMKTPTRSIG
jgi:PadR family transcriptional regulator PadR